MKKIDVLLASYNGEKYIGDQIESIIINFSKLTNYECRLLVSDDNSTDNTVEIIRRYSAIDERIKLLDLNKKGGVRQNFYFLIKNTNADYVFFSDQDDFWLPEKMEIFMDRFCSVESVGAQPILIHSDLCVVDKNLSPINISMFNYQKINKTPTFLDLIVSNSVTGCVMACNRDLIELAKNSSIKDSIMHDWYMALIASAHGKVEFIDKPLILYRQHGNNQVGAKNLSWKNVIKLNGIRTSLIAAKNSVLKTKIQASLFFKDFNGIISGDKANDLKDYVNSFNSCLFKRLSLYMSGKVKKKGAVRNFVLFFAFVL